MEVSIGTLIVGSLYWDDAPNRAKWRRERLDLAKSKEVIVPIRYGRRSCTRGNSYTMVFSESLARQEVILGRAVAAPCIRSAPSIQALVEEAEYLWAAERNSDSLNARLSAKWGCVAVVTNPARRIPKEMWDGWSARVAQEPGYGRLCRANDEGELVSVDGLLQIPWPERTDGLPLELDILLATATSPTIVDGRYPSAREVASGWQHPAGRAHIEYFRRNKQCGITTFQDHEIENHLNES